MASIVERQVVGRVFFRPTITTSIEITWRKRKSAQKDARPRSHRLDVVHTNGPVMAWFHLVAGEEMFFRWDPHPSNIDWNYYGAYLRLDRYDRDWQMVATVTEVQP